MKFKSREQQAAVMIQLQGGRARKNRAFARNHVSSKIHTKPVNTTKKAALWSGDPQGHSEAAKKGWDKRGRKPITSVQELSGMGKGKWREEHHSPSNSPPYTKITRRNKETGETESILIRQWNTGKCDVYYDHSAKENKSRDVVALAKNVSFDEAKRLAMQKIMISNIGVIE